MSETSTTQTAPARYATEPAPHRPSFPAPFGRLCCIEMLERLAYYAVRMMVPIYIMQADEPGGLHLTAKAKGTIYACWFFVQGVLPIFLGGFADRYGFRRVMRVSLAIITAGYFCMAFTRTFESFLLATMVLAAGTALFKPSVWGGIAQILDKNSASVGWGIFYWIVNVGSLIAPLLATIILGKTHSLTGWQHLFLCSALIAFVNLLLTLTVPYLASNADQAEPAIDVAIRTMRGLLEWHLLAFLCLMSAFWMMMMQLWDLYPNFINDWIDSKPLANLLLEIPFKLGDRWTEQSPTGLRVPQQVLLALNSALIVALVIPMSWVVRRMDTLAAMLIGMIMVTLAMGAGGVTQSAGLLLGGIALFSFGEMLIGPKQNEYLGLIAPPGKKGLYLGYSNLPYGIGPLVGAKLAGYLYGNFGEKATLALKHLAGLDTTNQRVDMMSVDALEKLTGVNRTEAFDVLQTRLGLSPADATELLWNTYHPQYWVWLPFLACGVLATIGLFVLMKVSKSQDTDNRETKE